MVSLKAQGAFNIRSTSGLLLAMPFSKTRVNLGDRSSWNSRNRSNTILLLFTNNKSQSESESTVFFITSVLISCNKQLLTQLNAMENRSFASKYLAKFEMIDCLLIENDS